MGYNNEHARPVVFDIETVAIDGAAEFLEPATAPSNYKDQAKIDAYIAEANQKALDKAALDLDLCRVVAIGWHVTLEDGRPEVSLATCPDEAAEARQIAAFWSWVGDRPLMGFNCLSFDVPVLLRRSLYLGVAPRPFQLGKYKHPGIIDLMQQLSFDGLVPYRSLSFYCRRFGLDVPADDVTGADIVRLVAVGDWLAVANHCRADVLKTHALAARLGLLTTAASTTGAPDDGGAV